MNDRLNNFYEKEAEIIRTDDTNKSVIIRYDQLITPLLPNVKTVLDIGCGDGYLVSQLRKKGIDAHGIDISVKRVDFATKKYGNFYTVASAYSTGFKDKEFDLVIASEVIEHLEDTDKALIELKRISKYVLLTFPYKETLIQDVCQHCLQTSYRSGHIKYFNNDIIENTLKRNGLKIINKKGLTYYPFLMLPAIIANILNYIIYKMDKNSYIGILCKGGEKRDSKYNFIKC